MKEFLLGIQLFTYFCALLTHVIVCVSAASWVFLLLGFFAFPIGIIHGLSIWIGIDLY